MIVSSYAPSFPLTHNASSGVLSAYPANDSTTRINQVVSRSRESREAQNIDTIRSEKFSRMAYDLNTPPYTVVGRLFDNFIRLFFGTEEPTASPVLPRKTAKRGLEEETVEIGDTTVIVIEDSINQKSALKYKTNRGPSNLEDILLEIIPFFDPLGYGDFLFKSLPLPINVTENSSPLCFGQNYIFYDTFGERASLLIFSLEFTGNCQLFEQQLDCIDRHLGTYFSLFSESIGFREFYSSNSSFPNSTHKQTFSEPSPIQDGNWTLKVSAYQNESFPPGPPKNMSPDFLGALEKQFKAVPTCERKEISRQKLRYDVGVGVSSSAAGVAIIISALFLAKKYLREAREQPLLEPLTRA